MEVDDLIALHAAVQAMQAATDRHPETKDLLQEHINRLRRILLRAWWRRM